MASKLIKFCIIHHHILRWKTTIKIGKEENHLGQLSMGGGDTSSKGKTAHAVPRGLWPQTGHWPSQYWPWAYQGLAWWRPPSSWSSLSHGDQPPASAPISADLCLVLLGPSWNWRILGDHWKENTIAMTMKQKREWGSVTALQKFFFSFSERKYTNITDQLTFPSLGEKNSGRCECWLSWRRWGRRGFSEEWNDGCFVHQT